MLLRFCLLAVLFSSAALLVRAQEDEEEAAVHAVEPKLKERGGYRLRASKSALGDSGKNGGEDRGAESAAHSDQYSVEKLIGRGQRSKEIDEGTKYLGTKKSYSSSAKVIKTRKDNYYTKNFVNEIITNLRVLRKKVNVHKHITYKRPLTVDHIKVQQHTNYIKNVYPQLNKLNILEHGTVVQPARLVTIQRTQDATRRRITHRLQVNTASRRVNLGTQVERPRFLGIRTILNGDGGSGRGNGLGGLGSGLSSSGKGRASDGHNHGNRGGGSYGHYKLNDRAAKVIAPQVDPEVTINPEEHVIDESTF